MLKCFVLICNKLIENSFSSTGGVFSAGVGRSEKQLLYDPSEGSMSVCVCF